MPGGKGLAFEQGAEIAQKAGYDSVEMHIEEMVQVVREKSYDYVTERFAAHGVIPAAWHVVFERKDAWRADDALYQQSLKALPHYAEVATKLRCPRAFTWLPSYSSEREYGDNFAWHVERLKPIAKILGDHGCMFGLEWQGPRSLRRNAKYEFIHTQHQLQSLIDTIDEPNVGFLLDTWHWYTAHGTLKDILSLSASQVVLIHISDVPPDVPVDELEDLVRELPGRSGIIDLVGFLKALRKIGYEGPVEPGPIGCPDVDAMSTLDAARANCEALQELMKAAGIE